MNYEEQLQTVIDRISKIEALLPDREQREKRLEQEERQLNEQLVRLAEQLTQERDDIEETQHELQDLNSARDACLRLVLIQRERDQQSLIWFIQELEEIELELSVSDAGSKGPWTNQLYTSIKEHIVDSCIDFAKEQKGNEGQDIDRAIDALERTKEFCDQVKEKIVRFYLASLLEARGSIEDYEQAEEEWRAIEGKDQRRESVLNKIARAYETKDRVSDALSVCYRRLSLLETLEKTHEYQVCVERIYRLGCRLEGRLSNDEKSAYEDAIIYYEKTEEIESLEQIRAWASKRGLTETADKAGRLIPRLELKKRQREAAKEVV